MLCREIPNNLCRRCQEKITQKRFEVFLTFNDSVLSVSLTCNRKYKCIDPFYSTAQTQRQTRLIGDHDIGVGIISRKSIFAVSFASIIADKLSKKCLQKFFLRRIWPLSVRGQTRTNAHSILHLTRSVKLIFLIVSQLTDRDVKPFNES